MNRRDFLKLTGLSGIGAITAKLGLPISQALAQRDIAESTSEPLRVIPFHRDSMVNDDVDLPDSTHMNAESQHAYLYQAWADDLFSSKNKSIVTGIPVYLAADEAVMKVAKLEERHDGYALCESENGTVHIVLTRQA